MDKPITVATAGNVLAPALSLLKSMGYLVEPASVGDSRSRDLLQATKPGACLIAEDPLLLLGLAALVQARGEDWRPTDDEIEALLLLDGAR